LGNAGREYQRALDLFDETAAAHLGVNRTDLRCLDVLTQMGQATPGELASAVGLTSGSVTAMLDRLEHQGYVTRSSDSSDGRQRSVRPTPKVLDAVAKIWGPLVQEGGRILEKYSSSELKLILGFLDRIRDLQIAHTERVRRLASRPTGRKSRSRD